MAFSASRETRKSLQMSGIGGALSHQSLPQLRRFCAIAGRRLTLLRGGWTRVRRYSSGDRPNASGVDQSLTAVRRPNRGRWRFAPASALAGRKPPSDAVPLTPSEAASRAYITSSGVPRGSTFHSVKSEQLAIALVAVSRQDSTCEVIQRVQA